MDLRSGILSTAGALGIDPLDLATAISYETAGTFDPTKRGPTTQWGQHRGLIQFGQPQAKKYGVDWNDPLGSQLGPQGAVANYLRDTGVKPGMGLLDIYSAINAGGVGRYNRSDANNGGAPGTVADKVNNQMAGHRSKAEMLMGGGSDDTLLGGLSIRPAKEDRLGTDTAEAPTMQPEKATGILGSLFPDMTADRQDRIAMALGGLSMHPNRAVMAGAQQRISDRRDDRKEAKALNKTLEFFKNRPNAELYAGAIAAGANPSQVLNSYVRAQQDLSDPSVQSSQMLPDQSGTVLTMRDGSLKVVTAGGETLTGNQAMDFVRQSQETAVGYEREKYGARRSGTLGADIDLGREANREAAAGTEEGKIEAEKTAGADAAIAKAESSISLIDSIMNDPALAGITGMVQGRLPPMTQEGTNLNVKIKQLQGKAFLEAFESLKGGGAITEREGQAAQNAMARLDRAQSTEEFTAALSELRGIMQQAIGRAGGAADGGGWTEINGVKIRVKK